MKKLRTHATHVGSGPRPKGLLAAYEEKRKGILNEKDFKSILLTYTKVAIRTQLEAGLEQVNDFEFGRPFYYYGNLTSLPGFRDLAFPMTWPDGTTIKTPLLVGKIEYDENKPLAAKEVRRVHSVLAEEGEKNVEVKVTLTAPAHFGFFYPDPKSAERFTRDAGILKEISRIKRGVEEFYPTKRGFLEEIADITVKEALAAVKEGARVVQLDDPTIPILTTLPKEEAPPALKEHVRINNMVLERLKGIENVETQFHVCWGNVTNAPLIMKTSYSTNDLLNHLYELKTDTLGPLMVCDHQRDEVFVKDFQENPPPKETNLAVGVVDQTTRTVEPVPVLIKRAKPYLDLVGYERLYLSPGCGFESDVPFTIHDLGSVKAKLTNMVKASKDLAAA